MARAAWIAIGVGIAGLAYNRYATQKLQANLIAALVPNPPVPGHFDASGLWVENGVGFVPGDIGGFDATTGVFGPSVLDAHMLLPGDYIPTLVDPPVPILQPDESPTIDDWRVLD